MIADLKPYPAMKDSGVEWLGEVPEDWDILRGRRLFRIEKRIVGELGHPVISVTQEGLRVRNVGTGEGQVSQDYSKYQIVKPGDFAMNSMDLLTGGVGIADRAGVTSPDYRVFVIGDHHRCRDRYMLHVLRMLYQNRGFYAWGQGSAQLGRWRLPRKRFNDFPFPVPIPAEQTAIVRYLDHVDGRIRRYIRAKQKLIGLLEEQKQAIIHRAVTRGLPSTGSGQATSDVPLKPSGVEWLGDVPAHWEVKRLKQCAATISKGTTPSTEGREILHSGPVRFLKAENVTNRGIQDRPLYFIDETTDTKLKRSRLCEGDVLFVIAGATLGKTSVVTAGVLPANTNQAVAFIRPNSDTDPHYLALWLQSPRIIEQTWLSAVQSAQPNLSMADLGDFRCSCPSLHEQHAILEGLRQETGALDNTVSRARRQIELLNEYRTRLIADVVTGKLDVRAVAEKLPEPTNGPDSLDSEQERADDSDVVQEDLASISGETET